jgi:hypothetical protein
MVTGAAVAGVADAETVDVAEVDVVEVAGAETVDVALFPVFGTTGVAVGLLAQEANSTLSTSKTLKTGYIFFISNKNSYKHKP